MTELQDTRADQVGSLLRPGWLKVAHTAHDEGRLSAAELHAAQDAAVRDAVAKQEAHGLSIVTDGEFRRLNFQDSFAASVSGYPPAETYTWRFHEERVADAGPQRRWDPGYGGAAAPGVIHRRPVVDRLRLARNLPLEEYRYAASLTSRPVKVTLIGPDRIAQRFEYESSRDVYPDLDAFVADVIAVERQMVQELAIAGCRYAQIDEPGYTAYVDQPSLDEMRARGEDPLQNLTRSIAADNALLQGCPEMTFGLHICRGNQRSMWHREGTYDSVAEALFGGLNYQRLLLEYDTGRAGGFEPLRFVPAGTTVVLGLVSTKTAALENADELKRRIDRASKYVPLERLAVSPQCGFASDVVGNLLGEEDQWRKLELVETVARDVWR
jgi:5-methyltetrahydropteroyltriglutamate--homocysteine methyltransferase